MTIQTLRRREPPGRTLDTRSSSQGCNWCRCGELPDAAGICGQCAAHFHRMLRSTKWHRVTRAFLSDPANRFCPRCAERDRSEPSVDVHHKLAWRRRPDLFWVEENFEGLCHAHHSQETARYDGGFGRRRRQTPSSPEKSSDHNSEPFKGL